mmetsp:Transcript_24069/g.35629  ORF Transcript_24069/g.35629 Transcript_24069/m.35629 type:complete len:157 (-) Transcript_24069:109-579(-)|eukprot:CAMPEP_0194199820 /NCGR_PEP_ID=MMETSP0156-20130528/689_1 /TAXON_ID=33649 /ORGANISM="Thalassionema nitzschioides, Strain L26-B" /LENGTH=156 /DNA_ID=CAMNT_0038924759 /DNA_START=74 /DNA_END=544 /DNA_ORIENTATION=+
MNKRVFPLLLCASFVSAFQPLVSNSRHSLALNDATGGWGVGNSRKMGDAEKAGKDRRSFEAYDLQDQGEFMAQVREDRKTMQRREEKELMDVAAFAGIDIDDVLSGSDDDVDDLDLRVDFELDEDGELFMKDDFLKSSMDDFDGESITRMDDDNFV